MAFSLTSSALSLLVTLLLLRPPPLTLSASMLANFTTSYSDLAHSLGAFLFATNFKAVINSIACLAIVHSDSGTIVWSAYPSCPSNATIHFSGTGILVQDGDGKHLWSTPPFSSPVYLVELEDSGNLVLRQHKQINRSLWESFDYPTDTIVIGQRLPVGQSLVSAVGTANLSMGDYQFSLTGNGGGDAVMTWNGMTYWKLSNDPRVYHVSNGPASYMVLNETGLYIVGANNSVVVLKLALGVTKLRIAKLEYNGMFSIHSYQSSNWEGEFRSPGDHCQIPDICGKIGVCSTSTISGLLCSCPPGFKVNRTNGLCSPVNDSYYLPSACDATASGDGELKLPTSYIKLEDGADYSINNFSMPLVRPVNLSGCEDLCSLNCSCLGFFHDNYSGSCYLLENYLGSIKANSTTDQKGYMKVIGVSTPASPYLKNYSKRNQHLPISGLVLLPSSGFLLIILVTVGIVWYRKRKTRNSLIEPEIDGIPGFPVRFGYKELVAATENFGTKIGSGGCGIVYKGMLPDESTVAVKKITSLGIEGKKEFFTEIAIIGNIRHVNLVRLKGFCTSGEQRFLVYEYINQGSLDQMLFRNRYVLEWEERFKIALGTARGLAYLHSACERKIIHCDVKPENILLDDNLQVKISDFGISKLLSREQSGFFSTIRGTRGYLAPDWFTNSAITDKTDVYSYGMVLLEIVRGRKNWSIQIHNENTGNDQSSSEHSSFFPAFALEMHKQRRYLELVDPRLEGRVRSEEEVEKLIRVALCCVHQDPALRPSMDNVVGMLEGRYPLGVPRVESLNFLPFQTSPQARRIDAHNVLVPQANAGSNRRSVSYMSSQQVSGPR